MGIETFFTQLSQTPATAAAAGKKLGAPQKGQDPTLAFLDMMLGNLLQNTQGQAAKVDLGQNNNPLLGKKSEPNLALIVAANKETGEFVQNFVLPTTEGEIDQIHQTIALNQQVFDDILKPVPDQAILIQENLKLSKQQENEAAKTALSGLNLADLQTLIDQGKIILSSLTPEQITQLQNQEDIAQNIASDSFNYFVVTLAPPSAPIATGAAAGAVTQVTQNQKMLGLTQINSSPSDEIDPAKLNAITVGEEGAGDENFEEILETLTGTGRTKQKADLSALIQGGGKKVQNIPLHSLPVLPSLVGADENNFLQTPLSWFSNASDSYGIGQLSAPITGSGNFTNLVGQASSASQPHPGTQMVAATIQKAGVDGMDKSILLQLDPPELGRVEVRMNFGKDKSVKTILTIEKPETLAMLQRDSHALERAITDIGLEADGSLSFELASQDHSFHQDGRHDGSRNTYQQGKDSAGPDENIILSTVTWHIDPASGHMRYNILA